MTEIITLGEILVEIMRPTAGKPLDQPGEFRSHTPAVHLQFFLLPRLGWD